MSKGNADGKKSIHAEHRERLKTRFRQQGLDGFTDVQVLEMLLFYSIPRRDTNEIAHELINQFKTLDQVLDAPAQELEKIDYIKQHSSTLLNFCAQLARRYAVSQKNEEYTILDSMEKCWKYMVPDFIGRRDETVFLLCLDSKCKVLGCQEVSEGSINATMVSVRKVVETALSVNAVSVMLAHNHPSGVAVPSAEDIATTRRIAMALDAVNVYLVDHIVVADDDYVSLYASGLYRPEECRAPM